MVNFHFPAIYKLLVELAVLIPLSNQNMKVQNADDKTNAEALSQANDAVRWVVDMSDKMFAELHSAHIVESTTRLRYWLEQKPQRWSELNTRARALRDIVETELG